MFAAALVAAAMVTRARFLMGTVCEVTAPAGVAAPAFAEAARVEAAISTWRNDSELSRINAGGQGSAEIYELLRDVTAIARETGGAFDPLVRPILDAWKIRDSGSVPDAQTIADAVRRANLDNVTFSDGAIALKSGARFEEGGFGKGYALDRMLATTTADDVVINFGGQIAVRGEHVVAIADPNDRDRPVMNVTIRNESLSTSSGSEKSFTVGGRRFTHIVDPRTGEALPPRGSVSVIDASALRADVLSTALYVMGRDAGLAWARAHGVHAIFISESGEIKETK